MCLSDMISKAFMHNFYDYKDMKVLCLRTKFNIHMQLLIMYQHKLEINH